MQTLLKQSLVGGLSFLLLTGIAFSVGSSEPSLFQGEALGSTSVVIAEIFADGSNSPSFYRKDYIVLFNLSNTTQSLNGWSIQTNTATSNTGPWPRQINLSGSIQPKRFFLVGTSPNATTGTNLPTPDLDSTEINLSTSGGKIALLSTVVPVGSVHKPTSNLIDFIGYGSTASEREGSSAADNAPAPGANAVRRKNFLTDTDRNFNDFEVATPNPLNASSQSTTAELFADYFLVQTSGKNGQCNDQGLGWTSILKNDYNNLTTEQKNLFVAGSANPTIANAVERYTYLRSINNLLENFANL